MADTQWKSKHAVRASSPNPSNLLNSLRDNLSGFERKLEAESQDLYDMMILGISDATKQGYGVWRKYNIDAQQATLQHAVKRLRREGLRVSMRGEFNERGSFSFTVTIRL